MTALPQYPVRLLSPTKRRITTVALGSTTSKQLQQLGWKPYHGDALTVDTYAGGPNIPEVKAGTDPRNGWIIPDTDPDLPVRDLPVGSFDHNPTAVQLL